MARCPNRSPDALSKLNIQPPSAQHNSVGCGLAGCLGGLLISFLGSAFILILLAFFSALDAPVPTISPPLSTSPDLRITLSENFLNRFAQQSAPDAISIDVLPGNRVQVVVDSAVQAFGIQMPVQITGLFEIKLEGQSLRVTLLDTRVAGIDLDLSDFFSGDIAVVNRNVQTMFDELSANVGIPMTATGLNTTGTEIHIEVTETP